MSIIRAWLQLGPLTCRRWCDGGTFLELEAWTDWAGEPHIPNRLHKSRHITDVLLPGLIKSMLASCLIALSRQAFISLFWEKQMFWGIQNVVYIMITCVFIFLVISTIYIHEPTCTYTNLPVIALILLSPWTDLNLRTTANLTRLKSWADHFWCSQGFQGISLGYALAGGC